MKQREIRGVPEVKYHNPVTGWQILGLLLIFSALFYKSRLGFRCAAEALITRLAVGRRLFSEPVRSRLMHSLTSHKTSIGSQGVEVGK